MEMTEATNGRRLKSTSQSRGRIKSRSTDQSRGRFGIKSRPSRVGDLKSLPSQAAAVTLRKFDFLFEFDLHRLWALAGEKSGRLANEDRKIDAHVSPKNLNSPTRHRKI